MAGDSRRADHDRTAEIAGARNVQFVAWRGANTDVAGTVNNHVGREALIGRVGVGGPADQEASGQIRLQDAPNDSPSPVVIPRPDGLGMERQEGLPARLQIAQRASIPRLIPMPELKIVKSAPGGDQRA